MNTASKTVSKLLISEAKILDTFGIISPLVETTTSSSTATIESTTAQISSKSSSPFNALAFKESPKLSPLSESTVSPTQLGAGVCSVGAVAGCVGGGAGDTHTQRVLKSPISPLSKSARTSPADSPILPFLGEAFRKQQQDEVLQQQQNENMLTSTLGSSNSSQQSTGAGTAASILTTSASSPTNSIKNIKCEPYTALSPLSENANSQHLLEESANNNNGGNNSTGSNNNVSMDTTIKRERDCAGGAATAPPSAASILRQNSNNSINSLPPANAASPHNGSDHSNSSNISSNISQTIEGSAVELLQDLNADKTAKKKANMNSANVKEEDNGVTPPPDKTSNSTPSSSSAVKNALCTTPTLSTLSAVKEEPDVMNNLINVKKEEGNISPDMSPVGFGSIANLSGGSAAEAVGRAGTPVKLNDLSAANAGNGNSNNSANSSSNNNNEKLAAVLGSTGSGAGQGCADDSVAGGNNSNLANATNEACSGPGAQHTAANAINSSNSGGPMGSCMEYMQQQNHIFVFSTQLANKGAESVLSGQFPTIIAYHCTQPATKSFLEDFFMKNPMKMSKLQRQNSFNLCNISVVGGQQWLGGGGCNAMPKMAQKPNNKLNFGGIGNMENKPAQRPPNISAGFGDAADALGGADSELMCWEQTRNSLENAATATESHVIKRPDGPEQVLGGSGPHGCHGPNKPMCTTDAGGDSSTPSLQGIKVPDENLTPQQRQHREEQLAKLKQIDQFLSNPLQGTNQLGKLGGGGGDGNVPGNIAGIMINLPGAGPGSMGPQIGNPLNPNMRNIPSNVMGPNSQGLCNPDNMPPALGDGAIVPPEMMGGHDMSGGLPCNANKGPCGANIAMNNQQNLPCGSSGVIGGSLAPGVNISSMPGNPMSCHAGAGSGSAGNINGPGGLMPNSPEMLSGFNQNCGGVSEGNLNGAGVKALSAAMHAQDMNQVGMAQMEWSKLQHQFFEERMKGGPKTMGGPNDMGCIPAAALCRSNATGMSNVNMRPNLSGACVSAAPSSSTQTIRTAQGPPPPYHPTQRSASVPIATQSPNPASPNNPTSNLSLPSPRTSGALGIPANSPNMDVHVSQMSAVTSSTITSATTTTAATISTTISNANAQAKGNFSQEGSPTGGSNSAGGGGGSGNNRNRNSLNQFNSNPSTPLSHMSPKDLDTFHTNVPAGDLKNARPSPQRSRTPLIAPNSSNINETGAIEGRFPSASPGLNFPPHMQNAPGGGVNTYKGPGPLERQNSAPISSQFCRRTDNLPLNPNSNRPPPNKLNHSFDPISSLAQMSQQLTSCVSLNAGGVGSSPGGMGVIGVNDMNMANNVNQCMDGMMGAMEAAGMDHCSPGASNNMGMPAHMGGAGPFLSNNCHINSMLGPMGQRLLNPKMCGGFNPANGGIRDGPGNMHGVMPSHRMMGRMAVNFGNFNVSPNIQVKASTPNTIQYMPVRPQNSNSSNMRVPPSLEFLQRYANPQMAGGGGNVLDNGHMGPGPNGHNDLNKIGNCNSVGGGNPPGMNFFGNCNQIGGIMGEQEDMSGGNMLPGHDMSMGTAHGPMIRGMRPMRQHSLGHGGNQIVTGPRIQASGGPPNIGGPVMPGQFPGAPPDSMECSDGGMFVGGSAAGGSQGPGPGPSQMFPGGVGAQQKPVKGMSGGGGGGLCQNMNVVGAGQGPSGGMLQQEHSPAMQSPVNGPLLMGPNSGMMPNQMPVGNTASPVTCGGNGPGGGGNVNYKAFVGPAANDLKYAQQYHSFQQQLYATSTRSQQGAGNANMGNASSNPAFFVNK